MTDITIKLAVGEAKRFLKRAEEALADIKRPDGTCLYITRHKGNRGPPPGIAGSHASAGGHAEAGMNKRIVDSVGETVATIIELWDPWTVCDRCGADTPVGWGLPVREDTCEYAAPDYDGEWGGVPACRDCHEWYEEKYRS